MTRWKATVGMVVVLTGWIFVQPVSDVEATGYPEMGWMATANWLGCDQNGPASECADYGTPDGRTVMMTCCVPRDALGTSDMSMCEGGAVRGRTEL